MTDVVAMDIGGRIGRLRAEFDGAGCDALLVSKLVNIRYLTGFSGSAAQLLIAPDEVLFVSDGRYRDQAADELGEAGIDARIEIDNARHREILTAGAEGVARLGLEADHTSWAQQRQYAEEWFPETELVPTDGLVESFRLVKDEGEVARIGAAAAIADAALAEVRPLLATGITERDFGLELDFAMRRGGAVQTSFETIVASGPNGAKPHARPGSRRVRPGDLVVIDFGAVVDGYCSDMTRMVAVGDVSATQTRMLEVVADAQRAGVDAIGPEVPAADVDATCRAVIDDAGWGEAFLHGTGHGVGLEIHEDPRVSKLGTDTLRPGYVVTVEPGVYLPEHGGVRIEDTLVVTASGAEALTLAPKHPALAPA